MLVSLLVVGTLSLLLLIAALLLSGMAEGETETETESNPDNVIVSRLELGPLGDGVGVTVPSSVPNVSRKVVVVMPLACPLAVVVAKLEMILREPSPEVEEIGDTPSSAGPVGLVESGNQDKGEDEDCDAIMDPDDTEAEADTDSFIPIDATADAEVDSETDTEVEACSVPLSSDSGDGVVSIEETGGSSDEALLDTVSVGVIIDIDPNASLELKIDVLRVTADDS